MLVKASFLKVKLIPDYYGLLRIADDVDQARGEEEAGQEGHREHLGKAGGPGEDRYVMPPPEPVQQVPPLPPLPLAGLV